MILSASRRTDIPCFYADWFYNRIEQGFAITRNPMYPEQMYSVDLSPKVIDGIVFWTKNPIPMLDRLNSLDAYDYYFQFTLNPYGTDLEPNVPSKRDIIIPAFQQLSKQIGPDKIVWRYDPILINQNYTVKYHTQCFNAIASLLSGYTDTCVISFLDTYGTNTTKLNANGIQAPTSTQIHELMSSFSQIAAKYNFKLQTCAETMDLSQYGITPTHCIDKDRFEKIIGKPLSVTKDTNQRADCGCIKSIDIGAYDGCQNNCVYCYAQKKGANMKHDPTSPTLLGTVPDNAIIKNRKMISHKK